MKMIAAIMTLAAATTASGAHVYSCTAKPQKSQGSARAFTAKGTTLKEAKDNALQTCRMRAGSDAASCALEKCAL